MQFGFMKGKATTDAIIMAKQMQENFVISCVCKNVATHTRTQPFNGFCLGQPG